MRREREVSGSEDVSDLRDFYSLKRKISDWEDEVEESWRREKRKRLAKEERERFEADIKLKVRIEEMES